MDQAHVLPNWKFPKSTVYYILSFEGKQIRKMSYYKASYTRWNYFIMLSNDMSYML